MAMQKNRNLFQLTLTWMFIFICLQCLFVKSLPTDTSTILPVKNTVNSTVQSPTVKDTGKVVGSQIITPNNTTTIKLIVPTNTTVSPGSQAPTITTTNDNKSSASPKITASPKIAASSKIAASPKITVSPANKNHDEFTTKKNSDLTTSNNPNSGTSKQSLGLGNQNETPATLKPDETENHNGLNKSTTTKKTDEPQDQSGLNKSTTESADKNVQNNIPGSKISVDTGETSDRKKDENKKPMNSGTLYEDDEDTGGHFMAYFITFVVICIAGYIIYHNKQKILAFILEGKKDGSRRRPNSKEYKRLKTDEVMPSLEKNTSDNKYIY